MISIFKQRGPEKWRHEVILTNRMLQNVCFLHKNLTTYLQEWRLIQLDWVYVRMTLLWSSNFAFIKYFWSPRRFVVNDSFQPCHHLWSFFATVLSCPFWLPSVQSLKNRWTWSILVLTVICACGPWVAHPFPGESSPSSQRVEIVYEIKTWESIWTFHLSFYSFICCSHSFGMTWLVLFSD